MGSRIYYPKQFDLGWVFYNEKNKSIFPENNYWEHIRIFGNNDARRELSAFKQKFSRNALQEEMGKYVEALENMSKAERAREDALLMAATGQDLSTEQGRNFVKHFNEIVQGQEQFGAALRRIEAAIRRGKQKNKKGEYNKLRGPSQAANYLNYFISAFNKFLEHADIEKLLNFTSELEWDNHIKKIADKAVNDMLNDFEYKEDKDYFGTPEDYERLDQYLHNNPIFYDYVRSYLKIEDIKSEIRKKHLGVKPKKFKYIKINDVFKVNGKINEIFARTDVGGLVDEFFSTGRIDLSLSSKGFTTKTNVIKSNKGATDYLNLATFDTELDLDAIEQEFQERMNDQTQHDIAMNLKTMDIKLERQKYSDLFVIHGSNKLYTMSNTFRGFQKTQRIQNIQYLLDKSKLGGERFGHQIVSMYYNTTPGAALDDAESRQTLEESLRVIIAAIAGNLLFSDWCMVGYESKGANQIHLFSLNGVLFPLSYVLDGMSKAMKEFSITGLYDGPMVIDKFERPKNILYPKPENPNDERYPNLKKEGYDLLRHIPKVSNFNDYWLEQREDARSKSKFRLRFLRDFKDIIMKMIEEF